MLRTCLIVLIVLATGAQAHNGLPIPILTDQSFGACKISLWAHPDVGTARFAVIVEPLSCEALHQNLQFEIGVEPVSGRLSERRHRVASTASQGQYIAAIPLDKQELWHINLYAYTTNLQSHWTTTVETTSSGLGRWDLLFFSVPFLGAGLLWVSAMKRKRSQIH